MIVFRLVPCSLGYVCGEGLSRLFLERITVGALHLLGVLQLQSHTCSNVPAGRSLVLPRRRKAVVRTLGGAGGEGRSTELHNVWGRLTLGRVPGQEEFPSLELVSAHSTIAQSERSCKSIGTCVK